MSISGQTLKEFKAIIWDDCSPDDTWGVLQEVVSRLNNPRFEIFQNKENLGLTGGLNKAINMSDTEYVAVVGSGDVCSPDRLEKQVKVLDENKDAVFCASDSETIDPVSGKVFRDHTFDKSIISTEDIQSVVPFTHGSVMYRRKFLQELGGYESCFEWCADWDLFFRLLRKGPAIYIPEVLYTRYAMEDGVSFNPDKSLSQIQHKYLAYALKDIVDENERAELLSSVRRLGLSNVVAVFKDKIVRDLWKRDIKLIMMKRYDQAAKLNTLINQSYGFSILRFAGRKLAMLISFLPVDMSVSINALRRLAVKLKMVN
jgi:glycosyltransferase involved in cell wall biosynthesis